MHSAHAVCSSAPAPVSMNSNRAALQRRRRRRHQQIIIIIMPSINRTARATTGDAKRLTPVPHARPDPSSPRPRTLAPCRRMGYYATDRNERDARMGRRWVRGRGELLASESTAPGACLRTDGRENLCMTAINQSPVHCISARTFAGIE